MQATAEEQLSRFNPLLSAMLPVRARIDRFKESAKEFYFEVVLSFQEQTLPRDIPSSFGWINSMDFYRFAEEGPLE